MTVADDSYYRKAFIQNNFYNAYSALTYFRKSHKAQEFYLQVEDIYHYWEKYAHEFMRHKTNDVAYTDEVYGMAVKTHLTGTTKFALLVTLALYT